MKEKQEGEKMEDMEREFLKSLEEARARLDNPVVKPQIEPVREEKGPVKATETQKGTEVKTQPAEPQTVKAEPVKVVEEVPAETSAQPAAEPAVNKKKLMDILPLVVGGAAVLLALVSLILKLSLCPNETLVNTLTILTYFTGAAAVAVGAFSIKKEGKGTTGIFLGIAAIAIVAVIEALLLSMM